MHKDIRIGYDSYTQLHRQQLTEPERAENNAERRIAHIGALFFLLRNIELNFDQNNEADMNIHFRSLGELGVAIAEGAISDLDLIAPTQTWLSEVK